MKKKPEPLPCPLCGRTPRAERNVILEFSVTCDVLRYCKDKHMVVVDGYLTENGAINAWNRLVGKK